MMKPFEPFEPQRSSSVGRGSPVARVRGDGRFVLNAAALREIGDATHVQLLWDSDTSRVGLRPTGSTDPLGFIVSRTTSQGTVTSREFINAHALPQGEKLRLEWDNGILISQPISTEPGPPDQ